VGIGRLLGRYIELLVGALIGSFRFRPGGVVGFFAGLLFFPSGVRTTLSLAFKINDDSGLNCLSVFNIKVTEAFDMRETVVFVLVDSCLLSFFSLS